MAPAGPKALVKTLVIAEAGVNHNGDLELARALIDAAADAGADLVKFQTFRADRLATAAAAKAHYQVASSGGESQQEMLRRLELNEEAHHALHVHCADRGVTFFSTAFDLESLEFLAGLGLDRFKIPSGEITNLPYLERTARLGKPVILSTGMATLDEVGAAIGALEKSGLPRTALTVLHCTTEYPAPIDSVNLRAMLTLRDAFGVAVGYSDHTLGIEVAIAAVALGATVIEKHLTLDRSLAGPDHRASLEPAELKAMVRAIRNVETALGTGLKQPSPGEMSNRAAARKSLVAARPIAAGESFDERNLAVKRPGTGVSPMRWHEAMGAVATRDFAVDELIEL